ncbi:MAG: CdaR family protein [Erysipelotrichaceae bacterium]
MKNKKKNLSNENKAELAKTIADKSQKLVKTYASVENTAAKALRWLSTWVDRLLFNRKYGKVVALVLAIILYGAVNMDGSTSSVFGTNKSAIKIENVPVSVTVNDAVYEVTGIPETVTVRLVGDLSDIQQVKMQQQFEVVANLEGLTEGTHDVKLAAINLNDRVDAVIEPSNITVKIAKKTSQTFKVGYDFVNTDKIDKIYSLGIPEFEQSEVTVRASQETINKISFVKALIDVSNKSADFETDAKLVAFDQNGDKVEATISPATVKAKVSVTAPKKDVKLTLEPIGRLPNNMAIESYRMDHQALTIYGQKDILNKLTSFAIQVPMENITGDKTITMPINLPSGVNASSISKVNIELKLTEAKTKELKGIPISFKNNKTGFKMYPTNDADTTATVILTGAQSVIDTVVADDLEVYIDCSKISETGTQDVVLVVSGKNKLVTYSLASPKISLKVEKGE